MPQDSSREFDLLRSANWLPAALCLNAIVLVLLMLRNGLFVDPADWGFAALASLILGLVAVQRFLVVPKSLNQQRWRDFTEGALAMVLICSLGAIESYVAAADTKGFYDATLAHVDGLLHFNWLTLYRLVLEFPILQHLGAAAYGAVFLSPVILIGWFAWHGEREQTRIFLATFWLASVMTLCLFPLLPARGPLEFFWHGPIPYMPTNDIHQSSVIVALRDHVTNRIEISAVRGLVCAPSFHTVCAIVYMVTAWPVKPLRRLLVPLNIAMLIATPVEGTHYLTDMILGAIVAAVAIGAVRALNLLANSRRAPAVEPVLLG